MRLMGLAMATALLTGAASAQQPGAPPAASVEALEPEITARFEAWMREAHVPGLVYGIVRDGRLVTVRGMGVADTATRRPVTADTRFRIASMSKAFTALAILKLRDEGKLSLDAPAERYIPEMRRWRYPTADSPRITIADLLHHTGGFVEDNPWGDRQQPISEAAFTRMLRAGVPFAQAPGIRMEYSNFGYAALGRIVSNVSGMPYQRYIERTLLRPLGMTATSYDVYKSPPNSRALGYRRQDAAWVREPDMADGAFGAMGGLETTANDYWRWVSFLLSAWPARDEADTGPVRRATVRGIVEGLNFIQVSDRRLPDGTTCRTPSAYAMAWQVIEDCAVGRIVTHSGGYPGYGSIVMLLPDTGVGVFAFANRTYAAPRAPVGETLAAIRTAGGAAERSLSVSDGLARAYLAAKTAWTVGDATRAPLADNVLLDKDAARRRAEIAGLKAEVGACAMVEPIAPISAMEGTFTWSCAKGRVTGRVQRAPTMALSLQVLSYTKD